MQVRRFQMLEVGRGSPGDLGNDGTGLVATNGTPVCRQGWRSQALARLRFDGKDLYGQR